MKNLRNQNVIGERERERDEKFSTFKNYKQVFGWILQWIGNVVVVLLLLLLFFFSFSFFFLATAH